MDNLSQPKKKVGLALAGGFIRAAASIGVIEVLEENNIPIDLVSGCSSGSLVAGAYAAGNLNKLKSRLITARRRDYWHIIIEPTVPKKGLLKGERNQQFFEEFVCDKNFSDLNKKLVLVATDLKSMKEIILEEGRVSRAIKAATAVPGIFMPVEQDGKILVDGGNFNQIPSQALYDRGADYVIAVFSIRPPSRLTQFLANWRKMKNRDKVICEFNNQCHHLNIFQLIRRATHLSVTQIDNFSHHVYPYDILVEPQVLHIKRWQVSLAEFCVEEGRRVAELALPKIKKDLGLL